MTLKNKKIIRKNITDYFDIPKNSWSLDGVDKSLNKAKSECKKLKQERDEQERLCVHWNNSSRIYNALCNFRKYKT